MHSLEEIWIRESYPCLHVTEGKTMSTQNRMIRICVLAGMIMVVGQAADALAGVRAYNHRRSSYRGGPTNFEIVLEGGMAAPAGNVSDRLDFSGVGKDAGTGYELGVRLRQFMNGGRVAIAPAIHYVEFGKTSGIGDFQAGTDLGYQVKTSLIRYGVDFQLFMGPRSGRAMTPFVSGGLAMIHNRYRDELEGAGPYDASANTPGVTLGAGLRASNFEMSAAYTFNRFSTNQMAAVPEELDYNWDYLSVRFGLAFGGR